MPGVAQIPPLMLDRVSAWCAPLPGCACSQFDQHVMQLPFSVGAVMASPLEGPDRISLLLDFFPKRDQVAFRTCCQRDLRFLPMP